MQMIDVLRDKPKSSAVWASPDGLRRIYTRRARTMLVPIALVMASALAIGPVSEMLAGLAETGAASGSDEAMARLWIGSVFGLGLLVAYRVMRLAIVVEPGQVILRGWLTNKSVPAADIARFEPPPPYGTLRRTGLRVVLMTGRSLSASAFTKGKLDSNGVGAMEAAELNAWLEIQRAGTVGMTGGLPPFHKLSGLAAAAWYSWLTALGLIATVSALVVGAFFFELV